MTQKLGITERVIPLWINNKDLDWEKQRLHPVTTAATGQIVHHYQSATVDQASQAVNAAAEAFSSWKNATVIDKRRILNRAAEIMQQDLEKFTVAEMSETSATRHWANHDAIGGVNVLREAASVVSTIRGSIPPMTSTDVSGYVVKRPVGVVTIISPWNAPFVLGIKAVANAVAAGCAVVLKGSEYSPKCHAMIAQLFAEAGAPPGLVNLILASREDSASVTEALFSHKAVRKVDFIGSAAVGRIVGALACKHLTPVNLEMGGKCPAIVLEDANLEETARTCAEDVLAHHGQVCFSTERIYVHQNVKSAFLDLLVQEMKKYEYTGSSVSERVSKNSQAMLKDAQERGAQFLLGDSEFAEGNLRFALKPTIVLEPPEGSRICDEESFGPSVSVYTIRCDEEAIEKSNASQYGLSAAIFTRDMHRGMKIADRLDFGMINLNNSMRYIGVWSPCGGTKSSGWGRQNTTWGIEMYMEEAFVAWRDPQTTASAF